MSLKSLKKEIHTFLTYGIGNISQSALSFLLLPFYMRYFIPEDYGVIAISQILIMFTTMVASAGMMSGLHRLYFSVPQEQKKTLTGTTYFWHIVVGLFFFFILYTNPK